jgi:predicted DNA-binding transcriptional regulator AlpA
MTYGTDELLNETDAADALGVTPRTLQAWRYSQNTVAGPAWVKLGRAVRYRRADLNTWIEVNRQ